MEGRILSQPSVSIIVAVYKSEQFLPKLLHSFEVQTHKNLQIILVDVLPMTAVASVMTMLHVTLGLLLFTSLMAALAPLGMRDLVSRRVTIS